MLDLHLLVTIHISTTLKSMENHFMLLTHKAEGKTGRRAKTEARFLEKFRAKEAVNITLPITFLYAKAAEYALQQEAKLPQTDK